MSDFIIAPGEIIKEYLDARNLTQKEVSKRTGVSERHLSQLLNGKTRLTEDMALKFEKVMPTRKVMRFYQINNKLDAIVNVGLARDIPLAE